MITELAVFEKMPEQVRISEDVLVRDGFDTEPKYFHSLIAEVDGEPVGYALYFYSYLTFDGGRFLYLEDMFIKEKYRGQGYGKQLFKAVVTEAETHSSVCMKWCVLNWNMKAITFYNSLGGYDITLDEKCHMYRFDFEALQKI